MSVIPNHKRGEIALFLRSLSADEMDALLAHVPDNEAQELRSLIRADIVDNRRDLRNRWMPPTDETHAIVTPDQENSLADAPFPELEEKRSPETTNESSTEAAAKDGHNLALSLPSESIDPIEQILRSTDAAILGRLLKEEHPQVIAVMLSRLPPEKSAELLGLLDKDLQTDCLRRLASMECPDTEAMMLLRCELVNQIAREGEASAVPTDSWEQVAVLLGSASERQREQMCDSLAQAFPGLRPRLLNEATESTKLAAKAASSQHPLQVLQKLSSGQLQLLLANYGESALAIAVASAHDPTWRVLCARLPREKAKRLASYLTGPRQIQLSDLEALQSAILCSANELLAQP